MKKILFMTASLALLVTACRKDRTCECTTTTVSTTTSPGGVITGSAGDPDVSTVNYKKVKKQDIAVVCADRKYTSNSSSTNSAGETTTYASTSDIKCVIK